MKIIILIPASVLIISLFSNGKVEPRNSLNSKKRDLYVRYKIDTIIRNRGSMIEFTLLDNEGKKFQSTNFCENGNRVGVTEYDENENEIKSTSFSCEVKDQIESERVSEYKNGKFIKATDSEGNSIFNTSSECAYDETGRIKDYRYYSFGGNLSWKEVYRYELNMRIKLRMKDDEKIIFKEITKFDQSLREIESSYYYDSVLTSKYISEYDEFGNKKRFAGYFYPGKRLDNEILEYYSQVDKLDSTKNMFGSSKDIYNVTRYIYDNRGLLIKEVYQNNSEKFEEITTYVYK